MTDSHEPSATESTEPADSGASAPGDALEPAPQWMVTTVSILIFLFVQGTIYRIIWPDEEGLLHYLVYFVVTAGATFFVYRWWKGRKSDAGDDAA